MTSSNNTDQLNQTFEGMRQFGIETIISDKKATFKFIDELLSNAYTNCKVRVIEKVRSNKTYYYISYDYEHFNHDNINSLPKSHPFVYFNDDDISYNGTEIVKNKATEQMIKILLMSFEDISKISGNTTPQRYKASFMYFIDKLWD